MKQSLIESSALTARTSNTLNKSGITTFKQIQKLDVFDLLRLGLRRGEIEDIKEAISKNGYSLKSVPPREN